jgi:ketohexokinase
MFWCLWAIAFDIEGLMTCRVPHFPKEDTKLRADKITKRRGGNTANSLEVLSELLEHLPSECLDEGDPPAPLTKLHLVAVLPEEQAQDTIDVRNSIPKVKVHGIYREGHRHAASSMIIQSVETGSRTVISHSGGLPEMTAPDFLGVLNDILSEIDCVDDKERLLVHFEGRNPDVTLKCIRALRAKSLGICISVECEKPEREGMLEAAHEADIVFFSRLWVEV